MAWNSAISWLLAGEPAIGNVSDEDPPEGTLNRPLYQLFQNDLHLKYVLFSDDSGIGEHVWATGAHDYTAMAAGVVLGEIGDVTVTGISNGDVLVWNSGTSKWVATAPSVVTGADHGLLGGLGDDDHPQYAQVAATETISAVWTFSTAPVFSSQPTLDHDLLTNKGVNTHSQIDIHMSDADLHFALSTMVLGDISNMNVSSPNHDQIIKYDSGTATWVAADAGSLSGFWDTISGGIFYSNKVTIGAELTSARNLTIYSQLSTPGIGVNAYTSSASQAPTLALYRGRGTVTSPVTINTGDVIGAMEVSGYTNSGENDIAKISFKSITGNGGAFGGQVFFEVADADASLTRFMSAWSNGHVRVGTDQVSAPTEMLEVNGAVTLSTALGAVGGTIQYTNNHFYGYNGSSWLFLSAINYSETEWTTNDATPTVGNKETVFYVNNSSSTTITQFDDGTSGQIVHLVFTNSNTAVQNGSNIRLQSGSNFSGTQYDTLTLVRASGVWYEIGRSVN